MYLHVLQVYKGIGTNSKRFGTLGWNAMNEFMCYMCFQDRSIKDFAFSFHVEGNDHGVCGFCAGHFDE